MPGVSDNPSIVDRGSATMYNVTTQSPNGDYSDQELQRLVSHFEVSRAELKNVGGPLNVPTVWECSFG